MKLYSYWRSSAAYRVRIALNIKGVKAEIIPINLLTSQQKGADYRRHNPQGLVPFLEGEGISIPQSMAILEYLEETYPTPALLPTTPHERAQVRALTQMIVSDIHPLHNVRVMRYLSEVASFDETQKTAWIHHWMQEGLSVIEKMVVASGGGSFCVGPSPSFVDIALVPQLYSARRFGVNLTPYPTLVAIAARCEALPAFAAAHPDLQVDKP